MLMISDIMRIGIVAGHVPVSEIVNYITIENILKKLRILNNSLLVDFGIRKPRIAVLGLNPHAGDNGVIGHEEEKILIPAIKEIRKEDIMVLGPFSADGFFGSGLFNKFDAILAMYHDQGLTPFKALTFENGVNYTAGLPVVRTSPAHGTAFELAGKDKANPDSFRKALYMACDIYKNRLSYSELTKNQMKPYDISGI
jgi:4-hydroxy-L-threonine phosphate dehydrogenase PdxA